MKFIQHPPSESKGSQGVPSIPTLTIVSSPDAVAPAPQKADPAPVLRVPAPAPAVPPLAVPVVASAPSPAPASAPTVSWQIAADPQLRALEMDLKKGHVISAQQLKQQLQGLLQSQQAMKDLQATQFEKTVATVKQEWQDELKTLEKNFEAQKAQWSGELEAKKNVIDSLQKEIAESHKQLEMLIAERKTEPAPIVVEAPATMVAAASVPIPVPVPVPVERLTVTEIKPSLLPPLDAHGSKPHTSLLTKLWNYLNQPAITVPLPTRRP